MKEQAGANKTQVKRFVAPTMARALKLVSDEMGPEAVILSSQRTADGVEVITSIEPDVPTQGIKERRAFGQNFDEEMDHPMPSDSAWKRQDEIKRAASQYRSSPSLQSPSTLSKPTASSSNPSHLAKEFERAHEKMLAAKIKQSHQAQHRANQAGYEPESFDPFASDANLFDGPQAQTSKTRNRYTDEHAAPSQQRDLSAVPVDQDERTFHDLKQELADMRLILEQQLWHMNEAKQQHIPPSQVNLPENYNVVGEHLKRLGLSQPVITALLKKPAHNLRPAQAWKACLATLSKKMPIYQKDLLQSQGVYAFVGPTGVGKTTTIAKLAAQYVMQNGPGKVAILTTDNYRVGAQDQLKNLGRILDVPVKTIDDLDSLPMLLASLKSFSLVLIDTAGFRQGDPLLKQQSAALDACPSVKRLLVMAGNSQHQTMRSSTHGYAGKRGLSACVLSKIDESFSLGEAISVLIEKKLPLAYTTDGQEIPADLSKANGASLIAKAVAMTKSATQSQQDLAFNQPNNVAFL